MKLKVMQSPYGLWFVMESAGKNSKGVEFFRKVEGISGHQTRAEALVTKRGLTK